MAAEAFEEPLPWIFQQDGALVLRSIYTTSEHRAHGVSCLTWTAKSSDFNLFQNVRGLMDCRVYVNGKKFDSIGELNEAICDAWYSLDASYICGLYHRIPGRLLAAIDSTGRAAKY